MQLDTSGHSCHFIAHPPNDAHLTAVERLVPTESLDATSPLSIGGQRCHRHFECRDGSGGIESGAGIVVAADGVLNGSPTTVPPRGMPLWNEALLWRGAVEYDPTWTAEQWCRQVTPTRSLLPIQCVSTTESSLSTSSPSTALTTANFSTGRWNRAGNLNDFAPRFDDWVFDWLDIPELLRAAPGTFLFPMVVAPP